MKIKKEKERKNKCIKNGLKNTKKKYLKYIVANYNCILEKTFGTKNKYYLARYCEYIIDVERHNEWAIAVSGRSTPTFFGWFDV